MDLVEKARYSEEISAITLVATAPHWAIIESAETGICSEEFQLVAHTIIDETHCIFDSYVCTTDWEKDKITLQVGETIAYKWISEAEFREFVNSEEMIDTQKLRYENYFREKGWIR